MSDSDDWQQRMKDEYRELGARIHRLDGKIEQLMFHLTIERINLLGSGDDSGDESVRTQLELLKAQEGAMEAYRFILGERAKLAGIEL